MDKHEQAVRKDVREMKGDNATLIGYVRGLLGSGANPLGVSLAVIALNEHKIVNYEEKA